MKKLILSLFICLFSFCYAQDDDWLRVYLASYPRSGNHWVRHLIEDATHIATSSVYRDHTDKPHSHKPFAWGGYCADHGYNGICRYADIDDIVVIKTHYPTFSKRQFDLQEALKTIRIVRHPIDSIYSFHVLKNKTKVIDSMDDESLKQYINLHKRFQTYWDDQKAVTFKYEDILRDPHILLPVILRQIGYSVSDEDIERAVDLNPPIGNELKHLSRYTPAQIKLIKTELKDFLKKYGYKIPYSSASR